jgi:enoyl-CoA hydratase/carnithine racemase
MNLEKSGPVYILRLGEGENRFNPASVAEISGLIAEVESASGPRALVTTGTGKFWSNGLDLDWATATGAPLSELVDPVQELFARVLEAGFPTVAAIQGHCYAAGAMLALAHDVRIMREDRGFLCLPEVDLGMSFTPGMNGLVTAKLTPQAAHQAMAFGRRYGGQEARAAGIVDETAAEGDLLERAVEYASELSGKDPATLTAIKRALYGPTLRLLRSGE